MNRYFATVFLRVPPLVALFLLTSAIGHAQDVLDLQLFPNYVEGYSFFSPIFSNTSSTSQCPAVGTASFTYNVKFKVDPVNDDISFQGTNGATSLGVTKITHLRATTTLTYAGTGNKVIQRQDWTRIMENPNGIDNTTGIRHYIGLFEEESQQPKGTKPVVTATTEGVMTLQEPLFFESGPIAGVATRVQVINFIGPQPAWLEPFVVNDTRICNFLATGVVQPVDPKYNSTCVADGTTTYTYNGVTFTGNIVSCP